MLSIKDRVNEAFAELREYKKNVFQPKIKTLQDECENLGHVPDANTISTDEDGNQYYLCENCSKQIQI